MTRIYRKLLVAGALLVPLVMSAVPARRDVRTVTQPDGTTLRVRLTGDERRHFLLTEDGCLITQVSATGAYEFASVDAAGRLVSTGVRAADASVRSQLQRDAATTLTPELVARMATPARQRVIAQNGMGTFTNNFPRTGEPNVLVILVEYKDIHFNLADPYDYFSAMLNEEGFSRNGGTGSCKDYFTENSFGKFIPHFDLYGPVRLSENRSYYGANGISGEDKRPEQMIVDACRALDNEIDFSKYDNDGDGVVDNVYVFYAGQGEADYGPSSSIWPHSYELTSAGISLRLDNVTIDRYATSNEWGESSAVGIGTFIHEFSHVAGLPDLYCTDYNDSAAYITPGSWSVLDYGPYNNDGRTPPAYSIYERNAMGWVEPRVIDSPTSISLEDIKSSNDGCIIVANKSTEFFLFENRQQTGWDTYVPGHGMLIWHIDYNQSVFDANSVNNTSSHQYVDIVEANGNPDNESNSAMAGYSWPGTSRSTSYTASTRPAFKTWSGKDLGLPITAITETDGVVSFDVAGGTPVPPPIDTPEALTPEQVGADRFTAIWTPVEGAVDYEVNLYEVGQGSPEVITADMGSGSSLSLPLGWTSGSTAVYTSYGNYGESKPSYKFNADGAWMQTAEFDSDVQEFSFWCRGQQSNGSTLETLGLINGRWVTLHKVSPSKTEVKEVNVTDVPAGVRALRFVWHKSSGNLSFDDVEIVLGAGDELVEHVQSTSGAVSHEFTGLTGTSSYYFTVAATDGDYVTAWSEPVYVQLTVNGIDITPVTAPAAPVEYYDMLGRRLLSPAPGTICIERRGHTARRVIVR